MLRGMRAMSVLAMLAIAGTAAAAAPVSPAATAPAAADPATAATSAPTGTSPQAMPHYLLLERALLQYQALAAHPDLTQLPALPRRSIKPDESWEGVPALRRLLIAVGDLTD